MQNICQKNISSKKDEVRYNIMLNHEVVEYDYEVCTHSCDHQVKRLLKLLSNFLMKHFREH